MDRGVADVGRLTTELTVDRKRDAYVRVLLRRANDEWLLSHASVLVGCRATELGAGDMAVQRSCARGASGARRRPSHTAPAGGLG
jgi:hypothetical protein